MLRTTIFTLVALTLLPLRSAAGAELVTLDAGLRSRYPSVDVTLLQ